MASSVLGRRVLQVRIKQAWQAQSRKLLPAVPAGNNGDSQAFVPVEAPAPCEVLNTSLLQRANSRSPTVEGESGHKALSDKCLIHSLHLHLHFCQTEDTPLLRLSACHSWKNTISKAFEFAPVIVIRYV